MEIKSGYYAAGIMEEMRLVNMEPKDSAMQTFRTVFSFFLCIYIIPKIFMEIKSGKHWNGIMKLSVGVDKAFQWRCVPRLRDVGINKRNVPPQVYFSIGLWYTCKR